MDRKELIMRLSAGLSTVSEEGTGVMKSFFENAVEVTRQHQDEIADSMKRIKDEFTEHIHIITNPFDGLATSALPKERKQIFHGPGCARCLHRFGTTSNKHWRGSHWTNEKCYRFKLDKNT